MGKLLIISLMLVNCAIGSGKAQNTSKPSTPQLVDSNRMTAGMTEIMDPEVKIIQPGANDSDAPSDANDNGDGHDFDGCTNVSGNATAESENSKT